MLSTVKLLCHRNWTLHRDVLCSRSEIGCHVLKINMYIFFFRIWRKKESSNLFFWGLFILGENGHHYLLQMNIVTAFSDIKNDEQWHRNYCTISNVIISFISFFSSAPRSLINSSPLKWASSRSWDPRDVTHEDVGCQEGSWDILKTVQVSRHLNTQEVLLLLTKCRVFFHLSFCLFFLSIFLLMADEYTNFHHWEDIIGTIISAHHLVFIKSVKKTFFIRRGAI